MRMMLPLKSQAGRQDFFRSPATISALAPHLDRLAQALAQRAHVANALYVLDIKALGQRADAQQYAQCGIRLAVFPKQRARSTSLVSDVKHAAITPPR